MENPHILELLYQFNFSVNWQQLKPTRKYILDD